MSYDKSNSLYLTINDVKVYVEIHGNKNSEKTLLFLHGASMNLIALKRIGKFLKEYKCVYFDFIGHGKTKGKIPNSISAYIDFTKDVLKEMKDKDILTNNTILIGYSLGGRLGLDICIHGFSFIKQAILLHVCDFSLVSVWTQIKKIIKKPHRIFSTVFGKDSKPLVVIKKLLTYPIDFFTIFRDFLTVMQSNPIHLDKIDIPITLISSNYDIFCPIEKVKEWYEDINKSTLIILENKGHTGILDSPKDYAICILNEIKKKGDDALC